MSKQRQRFTQAQRDLAVDQYSSGEKKAKQIALELQTDVQNIYRWKTLKEEQNKGLRIEELIAEGNTKAMAQKLLEKELEIEVYQKKLAELTVINELLKKLQTSSTSQPESELTGLIRTSKKLDQKRKPGKS